MDEERGETIHLLHPDGTVTVQFISAQDVTGSYITDDGEERQFITTDESGDFITTSGDPARYILAFDSEGQLIATTPPVEFLTGQDEPNVFNENIGSLESEQDVHEGRDDLEMETVLKNQDNMGKNADTELTTDMALIENENQRQEQQISREAEDLIGTPQPEECIRSEVPSRQNPINIPEHERLEQNCQNCANCYKKLLFQRGRSKKFTDCLYPPREYTAETEIGLDKHKKKEVTVLEALELLFDLKVKSTQSVVRFSTDYVFCYKCVSSLSKLHSLFVEFTKSSKSPSFMKSIFAQFGVLDEFGNVIRHVKSEAELNSGHLDLVDVETSFVTALSNNEDRLAKMSAQAKPEFHHRRKQILKRFTSVEKFNYSRRDQPPKTKSNSNPVSTRFPRSCKKFRNYRALAKVGQYSSDSEESECNISGKDTEDSFPQSVLESVGLHKKSESETRNRLLNLKNRIKMFQFKMNQSESTPQPIVKRKPGRPRKITVDEEVENIQIKVEPRIDLMNAECDDDKFEHMEDEEAYSDGGQENFSLQSSSESNENVPPSSPPSRSTSNTDPPKSDVNDNEEWSPADDENDEFNADDNVDDTSPEKAHRRKRIIRCKHCCATFIKQSHYFDHTKVHSEGDTIQCTYCQGTFNSMRNLSRHISINHRVVSMHRRMKKKSGKSVARRFPCPQCSFSFTRLYHLKSHVVNQHQVDPDTLLSNFTCPVCSRPCITDAALKEHLDRKHLVRIREKKNKCEECGKKFLKKSDLDNHVTTHTNIRKYVCEVCGFGSKRPQDLTRHRKMVHTKEVKHICQTCGKGYLSLWQMKAHQLTHDERKLFPCLEAGCGKSFRCPNNLRQHIQVHQGVKHVCQYCGESYSRTAYLARHIATNHLSQKEPVGSDTETVLNSKSQKGRKGIRKRRRTYELLDNVIEILEPEPMELDLNLPNEDGQTQVILHGFDDRYDGVIMEYIIG